MEALFFVGNQLIATSHTGRIGVWNAVTKHWQVRALGLTTPFSHTADLVEGLSVPPHLERVREPNSVPELAVGGGEELPRGGAMELTYEWTGLKGRGEDSLGPRCGVWEIDLVGGRSTERSSDICYPPQPGPYPKC